MRSGTPGARVFAITFVSAWVPVAMCQQEVLATSPSTYLSVGIEKGLVIAKVRNQPLSIVMEQLASLGKVLIAIDEGVGDESVNADIQRLPLDQALRVLLSNHDAFYYYGRDKTAAGELRSVWVYKAGAAAKLKPVPPDTWGSPEELAASLLDTDEAVRERAYRALMTRPDRKSFDLVVAGLRGSGEKNAGLRQRLLSRAVSNGFLIPEDVLYDLARSDNSEEIRWMALDALAQHPAVAKNVAEAALTDPSEAIRERAREILAESSRR